MSLSTGIYTIGGSLKQRSTFILQGLITARDWDATTKSLPAGKYQRRFFLGTTDEGVARKKQDNKMSTKIKDGPSDDTGGVQKGFKMVLAALNAPKSYPPPASEEEMKRRFLVGRNHVIGTFQEHNEHEHMIACKIRLKHHAIAMLPKKSRIKKEAMKIDSGGPPPWRHIPVWTPPIEGFNSEEFSGEDYDGIP